MTSDKLLPAPIEWAQRKNLVFITFCVEDCKNPVVTMEEDRIYFKGTGGTEGKTYENSFALFKPINSEKSKHFVHDRNIEMVLFKKEEGPYWPHLLKDTLKQHWIKVDFSKWRDEDDSDDELAGSPDFNEMMKQVGGLGVGDKPSLDDLPDDDDSDDEELPDLE